MAKNIIYLFISALFFIQCSLPEIEDVTPPVAYVIYPYENAIISSNIDVNIQAIDDSKISRVWFYVDGVEIAEATESPYYIPLSISGLTKKVNHVLVAAAEDNSGNIGISPLVNFIIADTPDIIPPTVLIVNPQSGQVVEGIVNITAYAEDERSVQKVLFYIDGALVDSSAAYPYSMNWNTAGISDSTSHTIFARAIDGGNNIGISPVIQVTVYPRSEDAADNEAPSALFLYPINASIVRGNVQVSLDLYDNTGVSLAEFYVDGQLEYEENYPASPWIFTWDTSLKADSSQHTTYVRAYDEAGNVGTSGLMVVTIE